MLYTADITSILLKGHNYIYIYLRHTEVFMPVPTTIQEVIDTIIAHVPGAPIENSVDTFKSGDPSWTVSGIVTTFTASLAVLQQAVVLGANLIITHEPTFYDHRDRDWLPNDPVYEAKKQFIQQHKLVVWRFHDYWHRHQPDGIITGMAQALGWQSYLQSDTGIHSVCVQLPAPLPLSDVIKHIKERLALPYLRVVGDLQMPCQRIGMLVGSPGGEIQLRAFQQAALDTVICGETVEWMTCEYVRDSIASGKHNALVILGHANSEELGMRYLVDWLQARLQDIPITFVPAGNPIQYA